MKTNIHFWSHLAQFFLEWEMFQTKVVEKIKTHILCSIIFFFRKSWRNMVELVRNVVAHGEAREGKWRGNWRMEWVASTLTPPPNTVYQALLKLTRIPRLPAVDWTDTPTDLNELVRFKERRNLVSARVPSRSARAIQPYKPKTTIYGACALHDG